MIAGLALGTTVLSIGLILWGAWPRNMRLIDESKCASAAGIGFGAIAAFLWMVISLERLIELATR